MIYVLKKNEPVVVGRYDNKKFAKEMLAILGITEEDVLFTEECGMRYVSRIAEVDGKIVYMNREWWPKVGPSILENYDEHTVYDFIELNKPIEEREKVSEDRFKRELCQNIDRINEIDGTAGEVEHNMAVGSEIISLLREECISVGHGNVTPESMLIKASQIIIALIAGCFREVQGMLDALDRDEFFTEERVQKYKAMIAAADAINYGD